MNALPYTARCRAARSVILQAMPRSNLRTLTPPHSSNLVAIATKSPHNGNMSTDQVDEFRRVLQQLFRRFGTLAADSTPCGKPLSMAHAHALMVLLAKGEQSQQELGAELGIDKSNVARLCAKLVESGHVVQQKSPQDARSRRVNLTVKGARLATEVDESSRERFRSLLAGLPSSRRASVIEGLQELVAALTHTQEGDVR